VLYFTAQLAPESAVVTLLTTHIQHLQILRFVIRNFKIVHAVHITILHAILPTSAHHSTFNFIF
jgi:hypothetical protein